MAVTCAPAVIPGGGGGGGIVPVGPPIGTVGGKSRMAFSASCCGGSIAPLLLNTHTRCGGAETIDQINFGNPVVSAPAAYPVWFQSDATGPGWNTFDANGNSVDRGTGFASVGINGILLGGWVPSFTPIAESLCTPIATRRHGVIYGAFLGDQTIACYRSRTVGPPPGSAVSIVFSNVVQSGIMLPLNPCIGPGSELVLENEDEIHAPYWQVPNVGDPGYEGTAHPRAIYPLARVAAGQRLLFNFSAILPPRRQVTVASQVLIRRVLPTVTIFQTAATNIGGITIHNNISFDSGIQPSQSTWDVILVRATSGRSNLQNKWLPADYTPEEVRVTVNSLGVV